jgi:hypothetical protein
MKTNILLFSFILLLLSTSCSNVKYLPDTTKKDKKNLTRFLKELPDVAIHQHYTILMEYMDGDYIKEQHDINLNGDDLQFVNEIFCGNDINDNSFHCINQNEITSFDIQLVEQIDETKYKILINVGDAVNTVACELLISKKVVNGQTKFGLLGAVG